MGPELIVMNPPRGTRKKKRKRRHFSAAQRRAQQAFAAMARAKAGKKKRKKAKRSRRASAAHSSLRKGSSMPKSRKKGRRRSRRARASGTGFARRGFALVPYSKDMIPDVLGLTVGAIATPKLTQKIGAKFYSNADGTVNATKYMLAKAAIGTAMAVAANMAGQRRIGRAIATGALANAAFDFITRSMPSLSPAYTPPSTAAAAAAIAAAKTGTSGYFAPANRGVSGYFVPPNRVAAYS